MLSAVIRSEHSYPALLLAEQQVHQRFVHSGPLVLRTKPFKNQRLQQIGDQPVLRRSEPSSRITLNGEQPYPWELLHPRDVMSRHRCRYLSAITRRIGLYLHPSQAPLELGVGVLAFLLLRKTPALTKLSLYRVIPIYIGRLPTVSPSEYKYSVGVHRYKPIF